MSAEQRQLRRTAYIRVSMATHSWKMEYFARHPQGFKIGSGKPTAPNEDIWDHLQRESTPEFNRDNWIRYYPLFREQVERFCKEMQDTQSAYLDILDAHLRSKMEGTCSSMRAAGTVYYWLSKGGMGKDTPVGFRGTFIQAFRELGELDAEAQRLRDKYKE